MNYKNLLVDNSDGVIILTINRPNSLNALNRATMAEIDRFFGKDVLNINGLKGIIITGAGERAFVAGADIKEFLKLEGDQGQELSQVGQDIFFKIERFHRPVIAVVNGFALGGGCELAMACHMRIATPNAKFGQPEINLGIIPGYGGTQRLIQFLGKSKATELLLTADMLDSFEAKEMGLVNYVLSSNLAIVKAQQLIEKIAKKGPLAVKSTIDLINDYYNNEVNGFVAEVEAFGRVTKTNDFVEGATAFIEKRRPKFSGT